MKTLGNRKHVFKAMYSCIRSLYRIAGVLVCANLLDEHPTAIKQVLKKLDCRRHAYTASLSERLMA